MQRMCRAIMAILDSHFGFCFGRMGVRICVQKLNPVIEIAGFADCTGNLIPSVLKMATAGLSKESGILALLTICYTH